jgi:DNA polymerase III subunit delta'
VNAKTIEAPPESDAFPGAPHPRLASRLIGHDSVERDALAAIREGRLPHAWLVGGPEGIGKATFAWRLARFLLAYPATSADVAARQNTLDAPFDVQGSRLLTSLAHPDLALIRRTYDEKRKAFKTQIGADELRAALTMFQRQPALGGWRIALVDCAEDLNVQSANALLKVIEEPPPRSLILIIAHRIGAVLPTIRSRCRKVTLDPLSEQNVAAVIGGLGAPFAEQSAEKIEAAAGGAKGSVSDALKRLAGDGPNSAAALIEAAVAALPAPRAALAEKLADALADKKAEDGLEAFEAALATWITARARASAVGGREAWLALWDRLRGIFAETEAMNLDRRLAVRAILAEIEALGA